MNSKVDTTTIPQVGRVVARDRLTTTWILADIKMLDCGSMINTDQPQVTRKGTTGLLERQQRIQIVFR